MKRKKRRIWLIVLGVLVLIIIIIWPAAPLWARLGLKPVCVQGEWPHIKLVACPGSSAIVTPLPLPSLVGQSPIPLIVDDDGSPDGMVALLYFLNNPLFEVRAVTISAGEAHPALFADHVLQLLAGLGRADIPVGAGRETPLEGSNAFPEPWREASDNFWNVKLEPASVSLEPVPAAELIVKTINNSTQPVLVFVSGTHTNLAEAMRLDKGIAGNIRAVYIMGGSIYVPGNINSDWPDFDNKVAEWNIWVDPMAAQEDFTSGLPLHLVPLDATNQVVWTQADLSAWSSSNSPEGVLASTIVQMMMTSWSSESAYIWDLVAAVQATNSSLCAEEPLAISIITGAGSDQGRTVVGEGDPNASVCLDPDSAQVKALASSILGKE